MEPNLGDPFLPSGAGIATPLRLALQAGAITVLRMTWGEIAGDAVRKRGVPYFSEVEEKIESSLPSAPYSAFAAACAERLLFRHFQIPAPEQRPFTVSCRHPLDCMWGVLASQSNSTQLRGVVEKWLVDYNESPLNHSDGQDGPNDADHDPAAAFIYAAESLINSSPESAGYAMGRVMNDAFYRAADALEAVQPATGRFDDFIADCCHPIVQNELRWLQSILAFVKSNPLSQAAVDELRHRAHA